ncbi:pyridoxal 5'-phosphate synthase glutaminase subunit PdxT [Paenibacillus alkalitolerans]|uniref:pyridoxal 5'-phosphate synthase glutaminase subunit PdxT n=1 Tax=Paenibacillus alkalitolerans TaxID=2799335 RepID=UPI0018F42A71|nr:pyridoxal 5'-phosphate synthase glutaminase subunit PdxT [Paenibacillus alkalitolerans]
MNIGVLAMQGAVAEHIRAIESCGATGIAVKRKEQLTDLDGLIIPGGESTTIGKLMRTYGFIDAITDFSAQGKPIFGTCAGLIVLAKRITGSEVPHLALLDITVSRNAFGRQRESFEVDLEMKGWERPVRAVFIRAPLIESVESPVEVLASYGGGIVAVRQGHLLGASFHPELTDDTEMHEYFINMVRESAASVGSR